MSIRVFKYGLLAPTINASLVRDQLRLAGRYRNTLTAIERARRAALRPLLQAHGDIPQLEASAARAESELDEALRAVRAARAATRSRSETAEMKSRVTDAREARRIAKGALTQARQAQKSDPAILAAKDRIHASALELTKSAREHCGVFWGSYLLVEDAAGDSFESTPMFDGIEPSDPRFVRFDGQGSIGVQIQPDKCEACFARDKLVPRPENGGNRTLQPCPHSVFTSDAMFSGEDNRIRIERIDGRRNPILHLRIGSEEKRAPVWASFPMRLHRPFPPGSVVKRATVTVRRTGPRERWSVQFTLVLPDEVRIPINDHRVAVDVGWRAMDDGTVRVGYLRGTDGYEHDMRLPARLVEAFGRPDGLRRTRDKNFNAIRPELVAFLAANTVPDWLTQATDTLPYWRSAGRLAALTHRWAQNRFPGDEAAYDALEAWRYHDHHLWSWECDERSKHLGHRKDIYRVMARQLANRYERLVLEDFDLREVAQIPPPDSEEQDIAAARANRQRIAISELRLCLVNAFTGARVDKVSAVDSTHICHACGALEEFDAAAKVDHTCSGCATTWDQDKNACCILLTRSEPAGDDGTPGGALGEETTTITETRWQRAARLAAERAARNDAARKPQGNAAE
jgi:hypothetical protein